ncbi:hypothetical protein ACWDFL_32225 [Streptomyces bungoensis]
MNGTGRHHLLLTSEDRAVQHGWWSNETVAHDKCRSWIGVGNMPAPRVILNDEETGTVLTTWPETS